MEKLTFLWSLLKQHASSQSIFEEGSIAIKISVESVDLDQIYYRSLLRLIFICFMRRERRRVPFILKGGTIRYTTQVCMFHSYLHILLRTHTVQPASWASHYQYPGTHEQNMIQWVMQ